LSGSEQDQGVRRDSDTNMEQTGPRPLLLRLRWCIAITVAVACHLTSILLLAGPVHALDPKKRLTQYMHTSWRIQDGSVSAGMFSVVQTTDGYLWFTSVSQ